MTFCFRAQSYLHEVSQESPIVLEVVRDVSDKEKESKTDSATSSPQHNSVPGKGPQSALQKANTKKIGQRMAVELTKGRAGLTVYSTKESFS